MNCDYTGPNYSPEDLRSVIDAMCKSIESSGQIDEHEHPSAYSTLLDTAKWMAELEGQEPVAWLYDWQAPEGLIKDWAETNRDEIQEGATSIRPLYARPVPAEMSPDFTDTARAALLWVLWHHQGGSSPVGQPIRYALGMDAHERLSEHQVQEAKRWAALTKAESNDFRQARTAPTEPVNARLLDVATGEVQHIYAGLCPDAGSGSISRDPECPACRAISAAEAQQERLLQDMHDAGLEVDRVMAEPAPEAVRLTDYSSTVDRAWARFCGAFGDGPDAPYPGMIAAFETHYGQSFRDKEWRTEAACWAAAWSKATARAEAALAEPQPDALRHTGHSVPAKFRRGDLVRKVGGAAWQGRVVGEYSTDLTAEGYAVESEAHRGSVQIYPAKALELSQPLDISAYRVVEAQP